MTRREVGLAALGLAVLDAAVYGSHVADGGFYWDDWQLAGRERFPVLEGAGQVDGVFDHVLLGYRPGLGVLLPAVHALLGAHPWAHLLLAQVIAVAMCLAVFAVLRELGVERWSALAVAGLALVFPWGDSLRLWATAAINDVAVTLYLLGLLLALRGLRSGRRGLTVAALALYAASTLTYEICAFAAVSSFLLYRLRVPWRAALRRGALDWLAVGIPAAFVIANTPRERQPLGDSLEHGAALAGDALTIAGESIFTGSAAVGLALLAALALGAAAIDADRRRPAGALALAAVVGVAAAYGPFVPASDHYDALGEGVNNRVGLLAAIPYALLAVAAGLAGGALLARVWRHRMAGPAGAAAIVLVIAGQWIAATRDHAADWDRSAREQETVLAAIEKALPDPPRGALVLTRGARLYVAPGIPVFSVRWDLKPAVRLRYGRRDLRAYPLPPGARLYCGRRFAGPGIEGYEPGRSALYGRVFVVDVPSREATRVTSRDVCRSL